MTYNDNNIRNRGRGAVPPPPAAPPGAAAASPSLSQRSTPSSRSRGRLGQKEASAYGRTLHLTDDEVDAVIENFMHVDDDRQKTMSRLLVEKYLSNWTWYNPQRNKSHGPSLTKAYAYCEYSVVRVFKLSLFVVKFVPGFSFVGFHLIFFPLPVS
jgi:hypothetical protein